MNKCKKLFCGIFSLCVAFTATACGEKHTHIYRESITAPTCTTQGYSTFSCECGNSYVDKYVEKVNHSYREEITTNATCIQSGVKKFTCNNCGDNYTDNFNMAELSASDVFELSKNSVGEIITYNKSGSELALGTGFVYSEDGKVITNYHVIEDAYSAKITINGNTYTVQSVLAYDKTIDLAVLKINATGLSVLDICAREHSVGKAVYAFGSSKGLTATFSQGIITYADREIDGVHYVQHDSAISSGNSGGPLINQFGEIIGVNTMTMRDSQNLNFAISVKELANLVYGTPLTVAEFYEKECDVFTKVKNYIIQNGTYDSSDRQYTLNFALTDISTTLSYRTVGYYYVDDDYIELGNYLTDGSTGRMVFITIDTIDSVYSWSYLDTSDYYMRGTLYASTWTSDSLLGVSNYSVPSSLISSVRELASSMVNLLLSDIKYDYADINIEASDFGFINY